MQRRFGQLDDAWPAGLGRRLGAMLYDSFLIAAIWTFIASLHLLFLRYGLGIDAERIGIETAHVASLRFLLVVSGFAFFAFFWVRGGTTLGMQTWRLRVQTLDGHSISMLQSLVRYLVAGVSLAVFGLGYFWVLFDAEHRSWGDIASGTRVVVLPKPTK